MGVCGFQEEQARCNIQNNRQIWRHKIWGILKKKGLPSDMNGKNLPANAGRTLRDVGWIPGVGEESPGGSSSQSSILVWKSWTEESGGTMSPCGHRESDMTEVTSCRYAARTCDKATENRTQQPTINKVKY